MIYVKALEEGLLWIPPNSFSRVLLDIYILCGIFTIVDPDMNRREVT